MRSVMAGCLAGLCLTTIAVAQPAQAQTVRAYALVELTADSDSGAAFEALRSLSLMNCLQLVESLVPGEVVLHVECNDHESLSQALTSDFPTVEGVARVTIWTVAPRS
jgi:hypothetical protein